MQSHTMRNIEAPPSSCDVQIYIHTTYIPAERYHVAAAICAARLKWNIIFVIRSRIWIAFSTEPSYIICDCIYKLRLYNRRKGFRFGRHTVNTHTIRIVFRYFVTELHFGNYDEHTSRALALIHKTNTAQPRGSDRAI